MNARSARQVLAIAVIGFALCLLVYYLILMIAPIARHSADTFIGYGQGLDFHVFESEVGLMDLQKSWKPRLLSNMLASWFTRGAVVDGDIPEDRFAQLAGLWAAGWLALVFLLYLGFLGGTALIPILGTFAAVAFGYMPGIGDRIYPWDMPSLFFYTLFVCLLIKDKLPYMLVVLPIAVLFKETAIVLCLAFPFLEGSRRKRMTLFVAALALSWTAKLAADVITGSQGRFTLDPRLLLANLRYTLTGVFPHKEWYMWVQRINHPILINAGLLTAFFVYPFEGRHKWMLRTIVLAFTAGTLTWGVVFEYRIWFELIPILLYPLYREQLAPRESAAAPA